jgi:hypothetical protein
MDLRRSIGSNSSSQGLLDCDNGPWNDLKRNSAWKFPGEFSVSICFSIRSWYLSRPRNAMNPDAAIFYLLSRLPFRGYGLV